MKVFENNFDWKEDKQIKLVLITCKGILITFSY